MKRPADESVTGKLWIQQLIADARAKFSTADVETLADELDAEAKEQDLVKVGSRHATRFERHVRSR